ncbi:protein MULTIPLE CHLOROPLAST DIVISION SITE 1-like [Miscanthus floridulus]|uniref:protein MULTIPLE CHLOROPLAST DIVISION SITE 1-like n=1 Tax=Miscanthus floridulus TaxID=154761 RepID=UPI00345A81EE
MATASVAVSLPFRLFLPPRLFRGRAVRWPRPIRASASSNASDVAGGERKLGALQSRVGDLRGLVASVPPAVASIQKSISPNFVAGFCVGIAFLAAAARQVIIRSREHDNRGSVADLVRRGQLKSGQRGTAKLRTYDDPFNNPLVKIDEGTSTAQMFGKEYRLAPVRLTKEQQEMHQKRRSRAYQWKRPTVFLREGDSLPPDVDPDTVRWIPANHPFAAASSEVDEETAKQNVYQKDGVPSRVKAEHEALQARLEASNAVTKLPSDPTSMQRNERSMRSSGKPSENLESSKFDNQDRQVSMESGKHSSDGSLQSNGPEGQ